MSKKSLGAQHFSFSGHSTSQLLKVFPPIGHTRLLLHLAKGGILIVSESPFQESWNWELKGFVPC